MSLSLAIQEHLAKRIEQGELSNEELVQIIELIYNYKVKRHEAEKNFKKLKEADIVKLFLQVPKYNKYMTKKNHDKAHLSTFINKRMFEDDYSKV